MKKTFLVLIFAAAFFMTGCSGEEKAGESTTEDVDQYASEMQENVDGVSLPSETVTKTIAKTWRVADSEDMYVLNEDGTGTKNGEALTFKCGFDDEKHITLQIMMDGAEELYAISADTTGYGLNLTSLNKGEDIWLLPADLEFLDMTDERAAGIVGEWTDESGNKYVFKDDFQLEIKDSDGPDTEGTYSVVVDSEGTLLFNIAVSGGALEYEYTLEDDGNAMEIRVPGTDSVHRWTKE